MWLEKFKIAIITKNTQEISKLIEEMPKFDSVKEMKDASYLLAEAYKLMTTLKDNTSKSITQLKKSIDFMDATYTNNRHKLDIKS